MRLPRLALALPRNDGILVKKIFFYRLVRSHAENKYLSTAHAAVGNTFWLKSIQKASGLSDATLPTVHDTKYSNHRLASMKNRA